jgi:hypothetical protein
MNHEAFSANKNFLSSAAILIAIFFLTGPTSAQTPGKPTEVHSGSQASVQQELVRIETGFFEAWKTKDQSYFREHMPENGVFWGESGTFSRDQEITAEQSSAKACTVEGYGLSDFGALPLAAGAYLLTYKAERYGMCNGEKLPVHSNGSSIYIFKAGRWQAIYRAEVPVKNPS